MYSKTFETYFSACNDNYNIRGNLFLITSTAINTTHKGQEINP